MLSPTLSYRRGIGREHTVVQRNRQRATEATRLEIDARLGGQLIGQRSLDQLVPEPRHPWRGTQDGGAAFDPFELELRKRGRPLHPPGYVDAPVPGGQGAELDRVLDQLMHGEAKGLGRLRPERN